MDDLVGPFTSTAPGTAIFDRLKARINEQKRYKKRAKDAIRQVYTRTEAVCRVLKLEMQKERVMFLAMFLFSVIDALCNRFLWCASDHLHTLEAISFSNIV